MSRRLVEVEGLSLTPRRLPRMPVTAITGALLAAGATPFDGCSFNFDSVLSDVS